MPASWCRGTRRLSRSRSFRRRDGWARSRPISISSATMSTRPARRFAPPASSSRSRRPTWTISGARRGSRIRTATTSGSTARLADDSRRQILRFIDHGEILVASIGPLVIGHVQLVDGESAGVFEVKSLAVAELYQSGGIGPKLVAAAVRRCCGRNGRRLRVSTAAAATGALRFYQRCGFRLTSVVRDAFPPAAGFRRGLRVEGIPLRDAVTLELEL
jgi:ribosomal protein S18 acetylase RimI-like enzyme